MKLATVAGRFTGGDNPSVLVLTRGDCEDAGACTSALPRRQNARRQDLQHPPSVADGPDVHCAQWDNVRVLCRCGASVTRTVRNVRLQVDPAEEEQNEEDKRKLHDLAPEGAPSACAPVADPQSPDAKPHRVWLNAEATGHRRDARGDMHRGEDAEQCQGAPDDPWKEPPTRAPQERPRAYQES